MLEDITNDHIGMDGNFQWEICTESHRATSVVFQSSPYDTI